MAQSALTPDGRTVVTLVGAVRVRGLPDGKPKAMLVGEIGAIEYLALSPSGKVAFVNLYGRVELLSPAFALSAKPS